ncbi:2-keto-4-pentenoate hydratase [Lentzea tibetensis]|uniref:2-keto-4-pentenoate hydratase n=1 Tax=Lentzea tibetensis TaxID=2591470 RepID=A0A563F2E4_9PSEU|nr:fumarylacetoacetate hydrolase family protein [Lentzea tibetensis]TWP53908.1 2-keto-4-pentenoate hydratase [Lentzea tibetensis]
MSAEASRRLAAARAQRRPCAPVRGLLPDIGAAYAVQSTWVAGRGAAGAKVVGRKIGLTNPAVRAQLGVDQPDFGVLLDDMGYPSGARVDVRRTLQPKIEAEIAFVLADDLAGPRTGPLEVAAATAYVVAALEIVDSRIAGWDISILDTVADNASAGLFVLGDQPRLLRDLDLRECTMTLWRGDDLVSTGAGADCFGDPAEAVAWLATTARELGSPLRAGEVVLSGALGPVVPVRPGDRFHAVISEIGEVSVSFTGGGS